MSHTAFDKVIIARLLVVPFTLFTVYLVWEYGYMSFLEFQFASQIGWQVIIDLIIALLFVMSLMVNDAKKNQRKIAPWLLLTVFTGSIGPLCYFATGKRNE